MTYITYSRLVKSLKICLLKQRDLGMSTNTFLLKLNENYRLLKIIFTFSTPFKIYTYRLGLASQKTVYANSVFPNPGR
jgi:hypothetical protein